MGYVYIALIDHDPCHWEAGDSIAPKLQGLGVQERLFSENVRLYCSPATPTRHLHGGAILLGHVFNRDGSVFADRLPLPVARSHAQLRRHLLENCWGEYLLVQPATNDEPNWCFMRDPSGGVPSVYSIAGSSGFITSDISLAMRLGVYRKEIDWDLVSQRLTYPYTKTSRTTLKNVRELLPGCSLHLNGRDVTMDQAWSPWDWVHPEKRYANSVQAAGEIRTAVSTVVRSLAQLDESVLLELSGGIDSSIVAACLKDTGAQVTCCTLVTPSPGADERKYAGLMANYLGVELRSQELRFEDAQFDFVPCRSSVNPRVGALQYAVNQQMEEAGERYGVSSYFSGGGGDTVFCYLNGATPAVDAFQQRGLLGGLTAIRDLSDMHQCTFWKAGRLALRKLRRGPRNPYKANTSFLSAAGIAHTVPDHPWFKCPARTLSGDREKVGDLAGTQVFRETVPRQAKRWFRMPLLSQPIIEACLKAPTWMWIAGGYNRAIARAAFADVLPREIARRRSKGTFTSYYGAVYQRNKYRIRDFLITGTLSAHGLLDAEALSRFFGRDMPPRDESFKRIFELCMVENWIRHQT